MSAPPHPRHTLNAGERPPDVGSAGVVVLRWTDPTRPWLWICATQPTETPCTVVHRLWGSLGIGQVPIRGVERAWEARRQGLLGGTPGQPLAPEVCTQLQLDVYPTPDPRSAHHLAHALHNRHLGQLGQPPSWYESPSAPPPTVVLPAGSLARLVHPSTSRTDRYTAAHAICETLATTAAPLPARMGFVDRAPPDAPAHWVGRYLTHGRHLYVGWTNDRRVFFSIWRGGDCIFGENDGWQTMNGPRHRGSADPVALARLANACARVIAGGPPVVPVSTPTESGP